MTAVIDAVNIHAILTRPVDDLVKTIGQAGSRSAR